MGGGGQVRRHNLKLLVVLFVGVSYNPRRGRIECDGCLKGADSIALELSRRNNVDRLSKVSASLV